jgi:thioredoxin-like negative regulator of GroEL
MKNIHLPLPDDAYQELKAEAAQQSLPTTTMARHAIQAWLAARRRAARDHAISRYASAAGGTPADLDLALERATVQLLVDDSAV